MARTFATSALLFLGCLLIAAALGSVGRAYFGQWLHDLQRPAAARELLPTRLETAPVSPVPHPLHEGDAATTDAPASPVTSPAEISPAAPTAADATPTGIPATPPEATPTPRPDFGPPVRMAIPSIDLDAPVVEVGIRDGTYEVPGWEVGWHSDSALLGTPGNSVFNGHLQTIDAGRVFARLHEVQPGDLVYLYSPGYRTTWVVESSDRTPNSVHRFLAPTADVRATLYTCDGEFDWSTRRYSHYRVVVARFVEATERAERKGNTAPTRAWGAS